MNCPKCNGEMWNNIGRKKNPKQPDYKCKDRECDGVIWPPKEKKQIPAPVNNSNVKPFGDPKAFCLSYAKDIVCSEIEKGIEVKEPFKRVADGFKVLYMAYLYPFGKPQPKPLAPTLNEVINEEPPIDEEMPY